jgi:hypothetical protein
MTVPPSRGGVLVMMAVLGGLAGLVVVIMLVVPSSRRAQARAVKTRVEINKILELECFIRLECQDGQKPPSGLA